MIQTIQFFKTKINFFESMKKKYQVWNSDQAFSKTNHTKKNSENSLKREREKIEVGENISI